MCAPSRTCYSNDVTRIRWIRGRACSRIKRLELEASLYQILQILSLTLFEKTPILCALQAIDPDANFAENVNQLILFNF